MSYTTITDVFEDYVDRCGSSSPVRTKEELRDLIHERGLRYEEIDPEEFWESVPTAWFWGEDGMMAGKYSAPCCGADDVFEQAYGASGYGWCEAGLSGTHLEFWLIHGCETHGTYGPKIRQTGRHCAAPNCEWARQGVAAMREP